MLIFVQGVAFILGILIVIGTVFSAVETFVLPRGAPDPLTDFVFRSIRKIFNLIIRGDHDYRARDRVMAFYAPVAVLALLPIWLGLVLLGYMGMYWAIDAGSLYAAFRASGSSLLTLGFESAPGFHRSLLAFSEATIGLILVALLIAYLPTMYAAFSRREKSVGLLEVRAGNPPSAVEMIARYHRIHGLEQLSREWETWEQWFTDVQESHTSLAPLVFFRSPNPDHSWVTAAGAVLDTAALSWAAVDRSPDPSAALCIRAGYLTLRKIADFFRITYHPDPHFPTQSISISRAEFDTVMNALGKEGVPLKADRDQAWSDFAGWRVNYDQVLIGLAELTMAPSAPWSSDRIL